MLMKPAKIMLSGVVCMSLLFAASACVPGRSEYYDSLHNRRERSYERWRRGEEEEHAPRLEGKLELADAVRFSLSHSPSLLASLEMKAEGRGRVVEAYSAALPDARISGGYTRLDRVASIDLGPESFDVGDRDTYNVALDVTQPLYQGGAIPVAQRAARLYAYLGDEAVRGAVENAVFQVSNAYYGALLAEQLVSVEEAALESAVAQLDAARARRDEGLARDYDVLRAQVEVSNIEASLIEERKEKRSAVTALFRAMGASQKSEVILSGELVETGIEPPTFEEAVGVAFQNRPDIFQATIEADLQKEALAETRTRYFPRLDAFYRYNWARPDPHESTRSDWGGEWRAGLSLNWTLFDGLSREGAIIQRKAQLRRQNIMLGDAEQRAIKEVQDALLEIESAGEMVRSQQLNLQRAEETQRLVDEGYREGINTEIELLDARSALTRARGFFYRSIYRQKTAELALQRATGELANVAQ